MRRVRAIVGATAREILADPFVFLVTLAALVFATLAPALHYHQFGESSRMATDAGLSALLVGSILVGTYGAVRTLRREIESGTALTALAHSVSRAAFFLSKTAGVALAVIAFDLAVGAVSLTVVNGATIGGAVARARCDIARVWGPSLALGVAAIVLPLAVGALLNRFARARFTLSAMRTLLLVALLGTVYRFDGAVFLRYAPAALLTVLPAFLLLAAAAAFAVRLKGNAAGTGAALVLAVFLPALGNYCPGDMLATGVLPSPGYLAGAAFALLPGVALFAFLGIRLFTTRDVG